MKKSATTSLMLATILSIGISGAAMAQSTDTTIVPGHPRVNEVDQRLQDQQNRVNAGVADGQINAKQEARDNARDAKVSQQLSADEAKNGGHITKAEDKHLNKELNKNSNKIHRQRKNGATTTPVSTSN